MYWFVIPRIETIKSSFCFSLSKLADTGVSADNAFLRRGLYSSRSLLAFAAILSRGTHLLLFHLFYSYFWKIILVPLLSLSPFLSCLILILNHYITMALEKASFFFWFLLLFVFWFNLYLSSVLSSIYLVITNWLCSTRATISCDIYRRISGGYSKTLIFWTHLYWILFYYYWDLWK